MKFFLCLSLCIHLNFNRYKEKRAEYAKKNQSKESIEKEKIKFSKDSSIFFKKHFSIDLLIILRLIFKDHFTARQNQNWQFVHIAYVCVILNCLFCKFSFYLEISPRFQSSRRTKYDKDLTSHTVINNRIIYRNILLILLVLLLGLFVLAALVIPNVVLYLLLPKICTFSLVT